mgnify:FL=1
MMQKQTLDFSIGYIFSKIEKKLFEHIKEQNFHGVVHIPKIWFGLPSSKYDGVNLSLLDMATIEDELNEICENICPDWMVRFRFNPEKQYIAVNYFFSKKEQPKKMTISEIEKALLRQNELLN